MNIETLAMEEIKLNADTETIDGEDRSRGIVNYLHQVAINPAQDRLPAIQQGKYF